MCLGNTSISADFCGFSKFGVVGTMLVFVYEETLVSNYNVCYWKIFEVNLTHWDQFLSVFRYFPKFENNFEHLQ